jgi:ABC-type sugar transport system substrate-binding protein
MSTRVLYVDPIQLDANPAIDAMAYGLQSVLHAADIQMPVLFADFREKDCRARTQAAIEAGIQAQVAAIIVYIIDPTAFEEPVAKARAAGIPVFTFVRPRYAVNASVVYPNFNHGVGMAEYLTSILADGSKVAIIGGPDSVDDSEELAGLTFTLKRSHCQLLNDPDEKQYCNLHDVAAGAREPTLRILEEFPRIDGLIPYNDETMLGALECVEAAGRAKEMKIISRNGSPAAVEAVRAGRIVGTWDLDASGIGTTLGEVIVRHLVGKEIFEGFQTMSPVGRIITQDNIDVWRPWSERVSWTPLSIGL